MWVFVIFSIDSLIGAETEEGEKMILLIDNYDSFSYNLYQYLGELGSDIKVIRNDELSIDEIRALKPD